MDLDPQYTDAIKGFEGYNPNGAWDYKQYSSGYGTKVQPGDENIPPDQRQGVYEQRFQNEVDKASQSVDSFAPNLPAGVRAALTSLTYNAGPGWQQSGLGAAIKSGDFDKARELFLQYNHAGGQVNPGLTARRQQEAAWFGAPLSGQVQGQPASPASPANGPVALPTQTAPIFPQAAPQQTQAAPDQSMASISLSNLSQAPPIFYAPRRSPDLSALSAALRGGLIFGKS